MKHYNEKETYLAATYVDQRCELGLFQAALLVQDSVTELLYQYGCDAIKMHQTHNAVWAIARTKICYDGLPHFMDAIRIKTYPVKLSPAAIHIEIVVESSNGTPLLRCRQELCAIDAETHRLRRLHTTSFPTDLPLLPPVVTEPFYRMKGIKNEMPLSCTHPIRASDTDMNHHMNNTAYVRLVLDAFPASFWETYTIQSFDIQYVRESTEGTVLSVFCTQEGMDFTLLIKADETVFTKCFLRMQER